MQSFIALLLASVGALFLYVHSASHTASESEKRRKHSFRT